MNCILYTIKHLIKYEYFTGLKYYYLIKEDYNDFIYSSKFL